MTTKMKENETRLITAIGNIYCRPTIIVKKLCRLMRSIDKTILILEIANSQKVPDWKLEKLSVFYGNGKN